MRRAPPLLFILLAGLFAAAWGEEWRGTVFMEFARPAVSFAADGRDYSVDYRGNNEVAPGIGLARGPYGISATLPAPREERLNADRPPTKHLDLKGHYHGARWGVASRYRYSRGFHAVTTEADSFLFDHSSLRLRAAELIVYRPLGAESRVRRIRGGIPFTGLQPNFHYLFGASGQSLEGTRPLLGGRPEGQETVFEGMGHLTARSLFGGVGMTLNARAFDFYCDPTISLGYGLQHRASDAEVERFGHQVRVELGLRAGYAGEGFGVGMEIENDANSAELGEERVLFRSVAVRFRVDMFL